MAVDTAWKLPERIAELSTKPWPQAISEWRLLSISMLDPSEDSMHCLCSHVIREICRIENQINGNKAIIGNHCIRLFNKEDASDSVFAAVPRIFEACKRILGDSSRSANEDLIQLAFTRGIFNARDRDFYSGIAQKRRLSPKQTSWKEELNNKLIYQIMLSPAAAYRRLVEYPTKTTGPDLINLAHEHGKLTDREWHAYRNNWFKVGQYEIEPLERNRMNRKIIDGLRDIMNV
jgi:hypothetical protein